MPRGADRLLDVLLRVGALGLELPRHLGVVARRLDAEAEARHHEDEHVVARRLVLLLLAPLGAAAPS